MIAAFIGQSVDQPGGNFHELSQQAESLCRRHRNLAAAPLAAAFADVVPSDPKAGPESMAVGPDGTLYLGSISSPVLSRAKPGETTAKPFIDLTSDKAAFLLGVMADARPTRSGSAR